MYSSCIFCNAPLGANEVLERFPVGRRIAYDQATGRLWVVCRGCERWNLTPLETRWEAIEDAERVFRSTPLKVSGENISLAQTSEGLELVRIGKPPKIELIAWRYGDQFGRRHRRHVIVGSGITVGAVALGVASFATSTAPALFAVFTAVGLTANMMTTAKFISRRWAPRRVLVQDDEGRTLHMNSDSIHGAFLSPVGRSDWQLTVPHQVWRGLPRKGAAVAATSTMTGDVALRALSRLLPHANRDVGSKRNVSDAAATIETARSIQELVRAASTNDEARKTHLKVKEGRSNIAILPARIRLAMEMALHEDDERRAMEGELAALEARWQEADALAKIADSLFLPDDVERELVRLKKG